MRHQHEDTPASTNDIRSETNRRETLGNRWNQGNPIRRNVILLRHDILSRGKMAIAGAGGVALLCVALLRFALLLWKEWHEHGQHVFGFSDVFAHPCFCLLPPASHHLKSIDGNGNHNNMTYWGIWHQEDGNHCRARIIFIWLHYVRLIRI